MAYVPVPMDLSRVKTKVVLNLTKRQLICFSAAATLGAPAYFLTRGLVGNSAAVLLMIILMLPAFFLAMYERDGQPAEKILRNILRCRWFSPAKRPYKTANLYAYLEKEGRLFACTEQKTEPAGKKMAQQNPAGRGKPQQF